MSDSLPPTHTPSPLHPVFLLDLICCPHLRTLCLCLVNTSRPAVPSGAIQPGHQLRIIIWPATHSGLHGEKRKDQEYRTPMTGAGGFYLPDTQPN